MAETLESRELMRERQKMPLHFIGLPMRGGQSQHHLLALIQKSVGLDPSWVYSVKEGFPVIDLLTTTRNFFAQH